MNFIRVDLHEKSITLCVTNENLKVLARKTLYCDPPDQIVEFFRQLRPALGVLNKRLNLVCKGESSNTLWSAWYDGTTWHNHQPIVARASANPYSYENYSNTDKLDSMVKGQPKNLDNQENHKNNLFLLSWTLMLVTDAVLGGIVE
jgi:hypothetical protein